MALAALASTELTARTEALLRADTTRWRCLTATQALGLPDGWIVAGFLRNLVWDHRFDTRTGLNDVDVVYFDPVDLGRAGEQQLEALLAEAEPQVCWQVRNQARMHLRHGHVPYRDCLDAISRYPECETAVGVRLGPNGALEWLLPFGLEHNWAGTLTANPTVPLPVFQHRVQQKQWLAIWPELRVAVEEVGPRSDGA